MPPTKAQAKPKRNVMPILARHAVSLSVVFVAAIILSYFAAQFIHQQINLKKLLANDEATFEEGLAYIYRHAAEDGQVSKYAISNIPALPPERGARVLIMLCLADAEAESPSGQPIFLFEGLVKQMSAGQALSLYDRLLSIPNAEPDALRQALLSNLRFGLDTELLQTVALLDQRLLWSKNNIPQNQWLAWLELLADSDTELTQFNVVKQFGEMPEAVDEASVTTALTKLAASSHDTVRNAVLHVAAGYAAIAEAPTDYEQIIFTLGSDSNKHIARRAWLIVGHLNPFSGFAVNWKEADPFVAEAMLWASVKTNPENPRAALQAINTPTTASAALLALSQSDRYTFEDLALMKGIEVPNRMLMQDNQQAISVWRRILALDPHVPDPELWYVETVAFTKPDLFNEKYGEAIHRETEARFRVPFYLAASYRLNAAYGAADISLSQAEESASILAAVEGRIMAPFGDEKTYQIVLASHQALPPLAKLIAATHRPADQDLTDLISEIPLTASTLLDLFALAMSRADSDTIDRFIRSGHPEMVTIAAMASAIESHHPTLITGFDLDFPRRHPDLTDDQLRAMTDAELAELNLLRTDALTALLEAAQAAPPSAGRGTEVKLLQLALWMRGDYGEDFNPTAEAMLFDDDLPASTVLMCLLHMQRPIALDYLFGDLVTPRPDLHKLFIQERYWHVFRRFVDTADLTLWLWGDPEAQAFQLEAMRQWYAVNKWKIAEGWWPELIDD